MSIDKLVKMSNFYGADEEYVLAGGGNTSFKDKETLYIKGSGTSLKTITADGFVAMDRAKLAKMWTAKYSKDTAARESEVLADLMAARRVQDGRRPSVETLLHDMLDFKYVLHVHPPLINGVTCSNNGKVTVERLFGGRAAWVDATKPGFIVALDTKKAVESFHKEKGFYPQVIFIESHGIFYMADTIEELDAVVADNFAKIRAEVNYRYDFSAGGYDPVLMARAITAARMKYAKIEGSGIAVLTANRETLGVALNTKKFDTVRLAFTPDHIVYCKHKPVYAESAEKIAPIFDAYYKENGCAPKIIFVKGLGMIACGKTKKEADIAAAVFLDQLKIAAYAQNFGGQKFMTDEDIEFIRNWEVESYRQKVSIGGAAAKRLEGKITIITGAAQGFGKGIAEIMAAEGAYTVIADLNYEGAAAVAKELSAKYGEKAALAVRVDVSDESSVAEMVSACTAAYGGLDIFVNNAGVLKSGSLEDLDFKSFEFVTKINYSAYFLCAKYASRQMKLQYAADKDKYFDIIQINSKSGLSGSNKNFAYAGSKFGGIGLTQSFALELVPYNIKVNSVCPGNLLDGPLWSDPDKGLFVQYLKAGKVPGAKTIADVKAFYEAKVPMNKGCTELDVARAIFYCVEQLYETGQAIPVTGGQNMLR